MQSRLPLIVVAVMLTTIKSTPLQTDATGCCPVSGRGTPVINADQTVIIVWDKDGKTQHFIRQAKFQSTAGEFGFVIPTPTTPELEEASSKAIDLLAAYTAPKRVREFDVPSFACDAKKPAKPRDVTVLFEKQVAGHNATVLAAKSAVALAEWLKVNGFDYSPAVVAWAEPYVQNGWNFTALKYAAPAGEKVQPVEANVLRMSFKTDTPLFPYREPSYSESLAPFNRPSRLLRLFMIAEQKMVGHHLAGKEWSGKIRWADQLDAGKRSSLLAELRLDDKTVPANWYLTEFEDEWSYELAPSDVYFAPSRDQSRVHRAPIVEIIHAPLDLIGLGCIAFVVLIVFAYVARRRRSKKSL